MRFTPPKTFLLTAALTVAGTSRADEVAGKFAQAIQPILAQYCLACHSTAKHKGDLDLEQFKSFDDVARQPKVWRRVFEQIVDGEMPPREKPQPNPAKRAALQDWLTQLMAHSAASRSVAGSTVAGPKLRSGKFSISDADRHYWAFQPVERPVPPRVSRPAGIKNSIDAFVLARLERKKLSMNPPATPRELVRRASFDLLGLPPTPEEVAAFEKNPTDAGWEKLLDRLLASPHYGERWGRHWLDLVRYAESNGYERDGEKPNAWRYRDYVIESFNRDKPYDRFIREQLAGDEIADEQLVDAAGSKEWRDAIIATGFYRLHVWDDEPDSTVKAEFDDLDDVMVTTGTAFLGLTIGCARCHDHKFDPISQVDYYSMLSFMRSIDGYGLQHTGGGGRGTGKIQRLLATKAELEKWEGEKRQRVKQVEQRLADASDVEAKKRIEAELKQAREAAPPFDYALAVAENGPRPKATQVLARGDAFSPKAEVSPAFPAVLGLPVPASMDRSADAKTTGRRRVLADWITSRQNPLTARVMVNRLWQKHFGVGIVPTPDDFGQTGERPTNQELLDYLASEFITSGWSVKRMHKLIMTSRAYRMSSRADNRRALSEDEANTLLWRQNLRRVEAEVVRDTMLVASGTLNLKRGGPSVFPTLPKEVHGTQDSAGKGWSDSPVEEQNRRSVYLVVKRALKVPLLECLDFANSASPVGVRPNTTTAPQALMLLNDSFVQTQAAALAARITREAGEREEKQITRAFQLVLQRAPTKSELKASLSLLADQRQRATAEGAPEPSRVALNSFCCGLLNLNEMIYVD
jgi:hypothetical protein